MAYALPQITVALVQTIKMIKYFPTRKKSARLKKNGATCAAIISRDFLSQNYSLSKIKVSDRIDCTRCLTKGLAKLDMLCFNSLVSLLWYY